MFRKQQFQYLLANRTDTIIIGLDNHLWPHPCVTGGDESMSPNLYHANPAETRGLQMVIVTKGRDINTIFSTYFQDCLAGLDKYLFAI
jgi:hypothetical protein